MKKESTLNLLLSPGLESVAGDVPQSTVHVTYTRRIVRLTYRRFGAQFGTAWVAIMLLLAVFAPVIANTHPLLMKENGTWKSPVLSYLTPADVALQVTFWCAVALLFFRRWRFSARIGILAAIAIGSTLMATLLVNPRQAPVYDTYRIGIKQERFTSVIFAPIHFSPDDHQRDRVNARFERPSREHLLGATADAADLFSNMIYASRVALSIGFVATGVAVVLGVVMGAVMGYFGGWVDLLGMRIVEIMESVPTFLLLLTFSARSQSSPALAIYIIMLVIGFFSSFSYAEFVRAEFLSLKSRDFVQAARAAGLPITSILFRHLLPNAMTPVIVNASFGIASAILTEATLSFLGIGLQTEASWGSLLEQALSSGGSFFWWLALYPGLAIFLTVFAYNLIGEALRDALDPKLNKMA